MDKRIKCIFGKCLEYGQRIRCFTSHYDYCELFPNDMKDKSESQEQEGLIEFMKRFETPEGLTLDDLGGKE